MNNKQERGQLVAPEQVARKSNVCYRGMFWIHVQLRSTERSAVQNLLTLCVDLTNTYTHTHKSSTTITAARFNLKWQQWRFIQPQQLFIFKCHWLCTLEEFLSFPRLALSLVAHSRNALFNRIFFLNWCFKAVYHSEKQLYQSLYFLCAMLLYICFMFFLLLFWFTLRNKYLKTINL